MRSRQGWSRRPARTGCSTSAIWPIKLPRAIDGEPTTTDDEQSSIEADAVTATKPEQRAALARELQWLAAMLPLGDGNDNFAARR